MIRGFQRVNVTAAAEAQSSLSISDRAAKRVAYLMTQESGDNLMLRVSVSGGGCAGFQYGFSFDDQVQADDLVFEEHGVKVVIDDMSLELLDGSEIDFVEDLGGAAFQIRNPNATSSCGCGTSFSV